MDTMNAHITAIPMARLKKSTEGAMPDGQYRNPTTTSTVHRQANTRGNFGQGNAKVRSRGMRYRIQTAHPNGVRRSETRIPPVESTMPAIRRKVWLRRGFTAS